MRSGIPTPLLASGIVQLAGRLTDTRPGMAGLVLDDTSFENQRMLGMLLQEVADQQEQHAFNLLCRPADVRLHGEAVACDHPNVLTGTVSFSSFVGGLWRTLIEVGQGQSLLAFASRSFAVSSKVWVELPPERSLIVCQ